MNRPTQRQRRCQHCETRPCSVRAKCSLWNNRDWKPNTTGTVRTHKEVAAIMGISVRTAKRLQDSALRHLRELLISGALLLAVSLSGQDMPPLPPGYVAPTPAKPFRTFKAVSDAKGAQLLLPNYVPPPRLNAASIQVSNGVVLVYLTTNLPTYHLRVQSDWQLEGEDVWLRTTNGANYVFTQPAWSNTTLFFTPTPLWLDGQIQIAWNKSIDPTVIGYKVYYGLVPGVYYGSDDVGDVDGYYFLAQTVNRSTYIAVTAYDSLGRESGYSNEVVYREGAY